ncbi:hypothetical protein GCM10027562_15320 [Arthrobacter pigmenti]
MGRPVQDRMRNPHMTAPRRHTVEVLLGLALAAAIALAGTAASTNLQETHRPGTIGTEGQP